METNHGKYYAAFGNSPEVFGQGPFETHAAALDELLAQEAKEDRDGMIVSVGTLKAYHPEVDADHLIDMLNDDAYETCGEAAEGAGWNGMTREETKRLGELLTLVLHGFLYQVGKYPTFGQIEGVEVYERDEQCSLWRPYQLVSKDTSTNPFAPR